MMSTRRGSGGGGGGGGGVEHVLKFATSLQILLVFFSFF